MPGSVRLRDCNILQKITSKQADEKRLYGAICAAPAVVLEPWGLLKRKQMTCHPAFMHKLPTFWAVTSNVQVAGEVTTSRGPGTAIEFALSFVEQMFGKENAEEVEQTLAFHRNGIHPLQEEYNLMEWTFNHTPRVLIPIADGSEEMEAVMMIDVLRRAKVNVVVASVEKYMEVVASRNVKIVADMLISDAAKSTYDLILLPGGAKGAERLHKSSILKKLLNEQLLAGRAYGETCSASDGVLHRHGLLEGKKAASHRSLSANITDASAKGGVGVVIDGKLITSRGTGATMDLALAIVSKLFGHARARSVAAGLVFEYPKAKMS
ncbi:protein DJ-1 homolog C isoform X2 [Amborella trichopoda]|nr:protein DJ-1 homolog C isoform X2 [Amborella trichopoda]XP_020518056.1 protein DJ-1 homolog C isoform X2 [Amborella trichopoda]XP_020518090.1 protein DJ-1 homolog C isoform X2 [Amborella trichopoda]|eukprot:XP_020518022.1 protein DJ-1 homolog C isoform X2 [Amborella trichopoda]